MDRLEWIAACAHQLQRRWRTVDPEVLEDLAADLWNDERLRVLPPIRAAHEWLEPVGPYIPPEARQSAFETNGILARIPGDDISRGTATLPLPTTDQPEKMRTEIDVVGVGHVRLTYRLVQSRHRGKSSLCFWNACHAEAVDTA